MLNKKSKFILTIMTSLIIIGLAVFSKTPVSAGTIIISLSDPKLCNRLYLPMIITDNGNPDDKAPLGLAPPPEPQGKVDCQAFADFNNDGYDDLIIGIPRENVGAINDAGAINVIFGTKDRLTGTDSQFLHRDVSGVVNVAEANDRWGEVVATGDFNGDGYTDVAVGAPNEGIDDTNDGMDNPKDGAGTVHIFYGGSTGITTDSDTVFSQYNLIGAVEAGDHFAAALAAGDFNGDGFEDLAVGVPDESVGALEDAGAINIILGSASGLTTTGNFVITEDDLGLFAVSQADDRFAASLTVADFDKDGDDDLAIGVPHQFLGAGLEDGGAVLVVNGSDTGLDTGDTQLWGQFNLAGTEENGDQFGTALTTGDFNGDSYPDLAVGLPYEDVGAIADAGAVNIIFGSNNGLTATGNQIIDPNNADFGATLGPGANHHFGWDVTAGDYDGDGYADLAVSIPHQDLGIGPITDQAGAAFIMFGGPSGVKTTEFQFLAQNNSAIEGTANDIDLFGWAVSTGDYNGDGYADLAVGAIQDDDVDAVVNAGSVTVFYGWEDGVHLGFEQMWSQNSNSVPDAAETNDLFGYALP